MRDLYALPIDRAPIRSRGVERPRHVRRLVVSEPFRGRCKIVLDLTGVGRPVADLFNSEGLYPVKVTITAGDVEKITDEGVYHVSKLLLVSTVQTLLHDSRLQIQRDLGQALALKAELEDFRATVTESGRWTFGARSGAHDDLVLALALAVWYANRRRVIITAELLARARYKGGHIPNYF